MIDLLKDLINIPSVSGHEAEIGHYLARFLRENGLNVTTQPVENESFNVLATVSEKASILLCTHMDTVAPFLPCRQNDNIIYGRGACDAKGQIVAMFHALKKLRASGITQTGLLIVVGEETNSGGAKKAAQLRVGSRYVVIGEPTDNKLVTGQKGIFAFKLAASGTGGHSSQPELGESAIHKLVPILLDLMMCDWGSNPELGEASINIGKLNGGVGMNVLAPQATAEGIIRIATTLQDVRDKIQTIVPSDIKLDIRSECEPQRMIPIPGFEKTVVGFGSDAAHVRPLGDILMYGPGSITVAHHENEHIHVKDLCRAVDDYVKIVNYLLEF